jgi:hypothetical protein
MSITTEILTTDDAKQRLELNFPEAGYHAAVPERGDTYLEVGIKIEPRFNSPHNYYSVLVKGPLSKLKVMKAILALRKSIVEGKHIPIFLSGPHPNQTTIND